MSGCLIVQSDLTVLLEVAAEGADAAREALVRFAELERAPEHVHTYRISPLSLWNAAVAGLEPGEVAAALVDHARYPVPPGVLDEVRDQMGRYGRLRIVRDPEGELALESLEPALLAEVAGDRHVGALLGAATATGGRRVRLGDRGPLKQALLHLGWPAADEAGYDDGSALERPVALTCALRDYQDEAVAAWWGDGHPEAGSGVLVLPCGAGKTVIGIAAMARAGVHCLVIATSIAAARQWIRELLAKTDLTEDMVGEYTGERKELRPITVATYSVLIWSPERSLTPEQAADPLARYPHLALLDRSEWGLVVYDEVHLLPAPVFRMTSRIQAVRRLGLTATLVREDGREGDVFSLIGPKRYDAPWRELEDAGWIAPATCLEVRVALPEATRMAYAVADPRDRYRLAATATEKLDVVERLARRHRGDRVLVIGQYLDQLRELARRLDAPLVTGQTAERLREERFGAFRDGAIPLLVVSRVANFSIDLPEANVAIQVSGTFGSRQEEAQRLGRILRPKADHGQARFYTVVARETLDQEYALRRQRFLAERGYAYAVVDVDDLGA